MNSLWFVLNRVSNNSIEQQFHIQGDSITSEITNQSKVQTPIQQSITRFFNIGCPTHFYCLNLRMIYVCTSKKVSTSGWNWKNVLWYSLKY